MLMLLVVVIVVACVAILDVYVHVLLPASISPFAPGEPTVDPSAFPSGAVDTCAE